MPKGLIVHGSVDFYRNISDNMTDSRFGWQNAYEKRKYLFPDGANPSTNLGILPRFLLGPTP